MQKSVLFGVKKTFLPLGMLSLLLIAGCSSVDEFPKSPYDEGVPVHPVFAKRAYNKPYEIRGETYYPRNCYNYSEEGEASYYGGRDVFHGRKTSMGHTFDKDYLTAAHKELPIPCIVNVTNLDNGRNVKVKINDRGPFVPGRIIDVSEKAARLLGFYQQGVARVRVEVCVNDTLQLIKAMPTAAQEKVLNTKKSKKVEELTRKHADKKKKQSKKQPKMVIDDEGLLVSKHLSYIKLEQAEETAHTSKPHGQKVFIDVGTFKDIKDAQKVLGRLSSHAKTSQHKIQKNSKAKQSKYRLLLGPYGHKDEARRELQKIVKAGARQAKIV
jgi:rare lipoprotein A